ncbi:MAG: GH3 auxin-responsive promoter family protein [Acetobacterium sp.]
MLQRLLCAVTINFLCFQYRRDYKRFMDIKDIEKEQQAKLIDILNRNQNSDIGKKYNFQKIKSITEYQNKVPLTNYEDYLESIEQIKNGEKNILTSAEVLMLELTSGSASASKLIPYTQSLKADFQKGLKPWIYNLYTSYKGLKWGKSYWSVTPATAQKNTSKGGVPIGFEEDSEYFGSLEKKLFDLIFAVPGAIAKEKTMDAFYFKTAVHLLSCESLTFISIWNPTYLMLLLEYMQQHRVAIGACISEKNKKRGLEVSRILDNQAYHKLWKHLKVISCWCDGNAESYAKKLSGWFPGVTIQPKGLLATEGFISFPIAGEAGARLSVQSHFFEFRASNDKKIYLAHELQLGEDYEVIITTSGGLYRYQLNDIIKVIGFSGVFPLIKFIGKAGKVSDLFGEKLNEQFIINTMNTLGIKADFYMIAPETDRYVLYIKSAVIPDNLDEALRDNFHYDYCRKLGQLGALRIFKLTGNPEQEYLDQCVRLGQRLGNIKPTALHLEGSWDMVFKGEYI